MACVAGSLQVKDLEVIIININSVFWKLIKDDANLVQKLWRNENSYNKSKSPPVIIVQHVIIDGNKLSLHMKWSDMIILFTLSKN